MSSMVLLNSGGIDSRIAAYTLRLAGHRLSSLHLCYNMDTREPALAAAERTAKLYCDEHEVVDLPFDWMATLRAGWVGLPFTGAFSHLLGAMYAVYREIDYVASGIRAEVMRDDYMGHLRELLSRSKVTDPPSFVLPLMNKTDDELKDFALEGVDLHLTYSCASNPRCGACKKCRREVEWGLV